MSYTHIFAGNPLDRGDQARRDEDLLKAMMRQDNTKLLPFHKLKPLVQRGSQAALAWIGHEFLGDLPEEAGGPKFLGFDIDQNPHFAVDISVVEDPSHIAALVPGAEFEDGRAAATDIPSEQSGVLAQARSNLNWHAQHRFCSVCGSESQSQRGGLMRECPKCKSQHFPRTDPVAIMLVYKGDRCVMGQTLARQNSTFYSCLAGFMDQGEAIEEGVRREVMEEAGIKVGKVTYHSSQPWPFPASLMIGCHAEANSDEIVIDDGEMSDVRWFTRDEVKLALEDKLEGVNIPGPIAIAHHLIKAWVYGTANI
ncbi:MAG TPA: NAD(+) diphosphatase [Dehalococcoidia bacterium]|nr:NAD(+) diphosphatase [Chloroflexota bacterium]MDP6056102.1 NAD(+) diphosphatase [Dehalococcoidia bacterium]MDP7090398.1 NAD(+) diphosphatase [Dehalococcoidia bacterium]MDP7262230.1 NAD(+) diphosphatase [Dehalococcoidia bacterium]MDP7485362.1 NAD(+) diphosphatase [Dehalococcoidia bacterium]